MLTFKYRLYPTREQQSKLWLHANKLNRLYNYFLNQRQEAYKNKTKVNKKNQQAELVLLKKEDSILSNIHSQVIQQVPLRLDNAYQAFFKGLKAWKQGKRKTKPGLPKFRSCRDFFGICYPQSGYSVENNVFYTRKYGSILFFKHRPLKGSIRQVYVSCTKNNKWFITITTDYTEAKPSVDKKEAGIDIGLKDLVVTSDGEHIKNCTHAKYFSKKISIMDSRISKKTKGSNRHKRLCRIRQRLYDVKRHKINDFQHKLSRELSRKYDTIFVENLSVKSMSESEATRLNDAIRNAKIGQFINFLKYKVNSVISVEPAYTSKMCNNCGKIHELALKDRTIKCECGLTYDRDENAAKNVYCLGQAIIQGLCIQQSNVVEAFAFRQK